MREGMHILRARSPFGAWQRFRWLGIQDVSSLVTQDVLVTAGSEDHFVLLEQFFRLIGRWRTLGR